MTSYAIIRIALRFAALAAALSISFAPAGGTPTSGGGPAPLGYGIWDRPLEGFGANTPGGSGGSRYLVTSLADSGPGTLRDAVSSSRRMIAFAVGGVIRLRTMVRIERPFLTIDGGTAPVPGITIVAADSTFSGPLVEIDGGLGAHDLIVRHLRLCDDPDPAVGDNLRIQNGAYNVVIDHCSFRDGGDGAFDLNNDVHDLTIQWCLIGATIKNQLIRTNVRNFSIHHNLYIDGSERNPQLEDAAGPVDFVNNVVFNWGHNYGTRIRTGSSANLVKNIWMVGPDSDPGDAVIISSDAAHVYSAGNVIPPGSDDSGNWPVRLSAPPVTELETGRAFQAVSMEAGAQPRDGADRTLVALMNQVSSVSAAPRSGAALLTIRPNPARARALLEYRLPQAGPVRLEVFDAAGRQVRSASLGTQQPGMHQVWWDGSRLERGAYLLRLQAGPQVITGRILLVR